MTSAIALLVVMSIRTTNITKPLKRLLVPLLQSKNPFLKVIFFIILHFKSFLRKNTTLLLNQQEFMVKNQKS